ncbi:putative entry exclusion protein TrbK-alt [Brevundimonas mediterranea]|uniref:Conjugative transfer region protein TrbK n=1 Tax=Brevundimonas mediterranea TaxID=74329 RepID=A0A7W6A424_9CAUL|nr:putative entry exclusion protein TrbK-alt [Brevundimonas mediterranea]MBB3871230.1 conjugative transfer region protein TrbK [Brevundimonas mediterranea]
MLARLAAVVFVAFALTATAIELTRQDDAPPPRSVVTPPAEAAVADPLRVDLIRCQALGEAATSDPACMRAWAENRRRFLAPGARPAERLPAVPYPPRSATTAADDDPIRKETAPVITPQADEVR